jgi:adenylyltransferase/sulfurtransferase
VSRFVLTAEAIDPGPLRAALMAPGCGGFASFEGWVRDHHEGRAVLCLEYLAYPALAVSEGERVVAEALARFPVAAALCHHRTDNLAVGDLAVWVGVAAAHRDEAFAACRYIIDELKHRVPIWKKEHTADGDGTWVECDHHHPAHAPLPAPDYTRQTVLPEVGANGQTRLGAARILVIGAGGLGSAVLPALAGAGIGALTVVDPDRLAASNLHRQTLYDLTRVGEAKAVLAAERLARLNPAVCVTAVPRRLDPTELGTAVAAHDLVVDCSDCATTKLAVSDAAMASGTPAVLASV